MSRFTLAYMGERTYGRTVGQKLRHNQPKISRTDEFTKISSATINRLTKIHHCYPFIHLSEDRQCGVKCLADNAETNLRLEPLPLWSSDVKSD